MLHMLGCGYQNLKEFPQVSQISGDEPDDKYHYRVLNKISEEKIVTFVYYDAANAIKATMVRPKPQGSIGETDMHAAQQHVPLLGIKIPWN